MSIVTPGAASIGTICMSLWQPSGFVRCFITNQEKNEAVARKLGIKPQSCGLVCDDPHYPDFCTSIEAAWGMVEAHPKIGDKYPAYFSLSRLSSGKWRAEWNQRTQLCDGPEAYAESDIPSMAIVDAFLKMP